MRGGWSKDEGDVGVFDHIVSVQVDQPSSPGRPCGYGSDRESEDFGVIIDETGVVDG